VPSFGYSALPIRGVKILIISPNISLYSYCDPHVCTQIHHFYFEAFVSLSTVTPNLCLYQLSSPHFIVLDFAGSWYISRKVYATKNSLSAGILCDT